ncbi:excinuclease ABC subunit UvrC [Methanogenium sp. MK-MG]|uniref:excinuclease ABC subunit UvrC n=1 Tax=Methanogenium sp. MK-MG TaxID=2599926 RepID=UPI0013ECCCEA|nr:excinuclease ABC subunit UvrC [Methanogenium sp. MK-MG]KAF1078414.1 UvrABC system protein C [Methanogenium sp. MK-MG]
MIDHLSLPSDPGCYLFKDGNGTVIYVGKAKHLKKRVGSYFSHTLKDPKTEAMVSAAVSLDFIVTKKEVEALILENSLIKRLQPKYNIDLKDSGRYAYIHLTDEAYPRIHYVRERSDGGEYFGPFVSAKDRDLILHVLKKTFRIRSCKKLPKRPCLRYHIGTCLAPCTGDISETDYAEQTARVREILKGNSAALIQHMKAEMASASQAQNFEKALELRDQIESVQKLSERQAVERLKETDEDIINYQIRKETVYLMLFSVYKGVLAEKQEFIFSYHPHAIEEFMVQYYGENEPPSELILPEAPDDAIPEYLSVQKGKKVRITVPRRGDKKDLLEIVSRNIETTFFGGEEKVNFLQRRLRLPEPPQVIECIDISHYAGSAMVGSLVQFRYGMPDKRNYRRFRIRSVEGIDDVAAIREVVHRRYSRIAKENGEFPDLVIIDGGKGQLHAAGDALKDLNISIPLISVAKREEEIFVPHFPHPLPIKKNEKVSLFIQEIRDEAHRFAVTYNRTLMKKRIRHDEV